MDVPQVNLRKYLRRNFNDYPIVSELAAKQMGARKLLQLGKMS
jgi:hypothetical protein